MNFNYQAWPNEKEAHYAEEFLKNKLIEASVLTPVKRELFYEQMFLEFRTSMGIEFAQEDPVVYTNINPMLALLKSGHTDIILKAYKDRLPLCGDGYFMGKPPRPKHKHPKYWTSDRVLPITEDSLLYRGDESPFFDLKTPKEVSFLAKCYSGKFGFSSEYVEACVRQLTKPGVNYDNIMALHERAFDSSKIVRASMELSGLDQVLKNDTLDEKILGDYLRRVHSDENWIKHAGLVLNYLSDKNCKHSVVKYIGDVSKVTHEQETYGAFVGRMKNAEQVLTALFPDKTKDLKVKIIKTVSELRFGFEEDGWVRDALKSAYTEEEIKKQVKNSDVDFFVKRFGYYSFLEKASSEHRASVLEEHLGL